MHVQIVQYTRVEGLREEGSASTAVLMKYVRRHAKQRKTACAFKGAGPSVFH